MPLADLFLPYIRGEVRAGLSPNGSVKHPAGIRSLVYGMGKAKVGIEGLERVVSRPGSAQSDPSLTLTLGRQTSLPWGCQSRRNPCLAKWRCA